VNECSAALGDMRTNLSIDDDVLAAAKKLAEMHKMSIGAVISSLVRQTLDPSEPPRLVRNGIWLLPIQPGAGVVTLELIQELMDELP
jgi:hypothetical protein